MILELDGKPLEGAAIGLTVDEALALRGYLDQMLEQKPGPRNHSHVSSEDFQTEISVWIIDPDEEPYWAGAGG